MSFAQIEKYLDILMEKHLLEKTVYQDERAVYLTTGKGREYLAKCDELKILITAEGKSSEYPNPEVVVVVAKNALAAELIS